MSKKKTNKPQNTKPTVKTKVEPVKQEDILNETETKEEVPADDAGVPDVETDTVPTGEDETTDASDEAETTDEETELTDDEETAEPVRDTRIHHRTLKRRSVDAPDLFKPRTGDFTLNKPNKMKAKSGNKGTATNLKFKADPWGFTTEVKKAVIKAASRIGSSEDKQVLLLETLAELTLHINASFKSAQKQVGVPLKKRSEATGE